jgi:uncharacterized protein (TIGR02145 family)
MMLSILPILLCCSGEKLNYININRKMYDYRSDKLDYKSVRIGNQEWMTENLDVSVFRNGDTIPYAKTDEEWYTSFQNGEPAWCYYNNNPSFGENNGKLYNWYAVKDSRGLAPKGWHIPTDNEWRILKDYLGGENQAGIKMKSIGKWPNKRNRKIEVTNESGFSAIPSGGREEDGEFCCKTDFTSWWSATSFSVSNAYVRELNSYTLFLDSLYTHPKVVGTQLDA